MRGQNVFEWYEALISAALVLVLVFSLFFRIIQVDGESMVPTLQNGDKLIVWGAGYEPQRGDVVIVDSYTAYGKPLVKRVIAKGGDVVNIDYQAGTVSVNGEVLQEAYIAEPTYLGSVSYTHLDVYKRQPVSPLSTARWTCTICSGMIGSPGMPVSYTHLLYRLFVHHGRSGHR